MRKPGGFVRSRDLSAMPNFFGEMQTLALKLEVVILVELFRGVAEIRPL